MSEEQDAGDPASEPPQERLAMSLSEFLETVPPGQAREIDNAAYIRGKGGFIDIELDPPEVTLHCGDNNCGGIRIFRTPDRFNLKRGENFGNKLFVRYICSNCQTTEKVFALAVKVPIGRDKLAVVYKFGEHPAYGPPTPSRLIELIGPDREMFLAGRRSENQGLGIGAFAYYRRVVENQKGRILDRIVRTAETLSAPADMIATLKRAQQETQFSKAVDIAREAMPDSLKISGRNPLTLLHSALSRGLHENDDATCLSLANAIRVVLVELSDRIGQALKDTREINDAVSLLMQSRSDPPP